MGYIPASPGERQAMLNEIGLSDTRALYRQVPEGLLLERLNLPDGLGEMAVSEKMRALAGRNRLFNAIFRGAGAYNHYIPAVVKSIARKEEFVTAYTPYQAEISQGLLQSIFEYQSMICELTGMDAANASVYDGATAAAEAVSMCRDARRPVALIAQTAHPMFLETIETYARPSGAAVRRVGEKSGRLDIGQLSGQLADACCLYIQQPNYYGLFEDMNAIRALTRQAGVKLIEAVNPIACAVMKTPGETGADVCVGEGQPLGMPLSFGGPYLGFMAVNQAMKRKLPGRIVGETRDGDNRRAFVLTLQAREQHIRREKASSNICSNQALCALTAAAYMAAMGPEGLRGVAVQSMSHAAYARGQLARLGFLPEHEGPFFHEFVTGCPLDGARLMDELAARGMLGPLPLEGNRLLWCFTELNAKPQIDRLISALEEVLK